MPDEHTAMLALLNGLLVGADTLLDSPGAWAERLALDTPVVSRFVNELADEWFDTLPPDAFCDSVAERVRRHLSAWHPGWPHLWAHILRVTGIAVALAEDINLDPTPAYLMGMCHDVAKLDEYPMSTPHEELGADFAAKVLRGYLSPGQIESIQAAILKEGDDDLAHILHDADKLDKIGAAGVLRRVSTGTDPDWLPSAIWRVRDDWHKSPGMQFDLSRDLSQSKREFLGWFLPLAEESLDD